MYGSYQEIFNVVKKHLLKQKMKCLNDDTRGCQYRVLEEGGKMKLNPDGSTYACAIGALIPNDIYDPRMEDCGVVSNLWDESGDFRKLFDIPETFNDNARNDEGNEIPDLVNFLTQLQNVHDMNDPEVWAERLKNIANHYHLVP